MSAPRPLTAHRIGSVALGAALLAAGCGDDGSRPPEQALTMVAVESQRCRQPNHFHGVGVVVGRSEVDTALVLTAGHTVEGELRSLTVDGEPARVVTIDRRTDLAILSADVPEATPPTPAPAVPDGAQLLAPGDERNVDIDRHVVLILEHATDQATYRRDVVIFTPGVVDGDSGSPLVDDAGRLVGMVIADQDGEGVAASAAEVFGLIGTAAASDDLTWPDLPGNC